MMPDLNGAYIVHPLTLDEFADAVREASSIESFIGYDATAKFIERATGVPVEVSRAQTVLQDNDVFLIIRLKYRLADGSAKRDPNRAPADGDYEFAWCQFTRTRMEAYE
jgi:hypothetical protein